MLAEATNFCVLRSHSHHNSRVSDEMGKTGRKKRRASFGLTNDVRRPFYSPHQSRHMPHPTHTHTFQFQGHVLRGEDKEGAGAGKKMSLSFSKLFRQNQRVFFAPHTPHTLPPSTLFPSPPILPTPLSYFTTLFLLSSHLSFFTIPVLFGM